MITKITAMICTVFIAILITVNPSIAQHSQNELQREATHVGGTPKDVTQFITSEIVAPLKSTAGEKILFLGNFSFDLNNSNSANGSTAFRDFLLNRGYIITEDVNPPSPITLNYLLPFDAVVFSHLSDRTLTGDESTTIASYVNQNGGNLLLLGQHALGGNAFENSDRDTLGSNFGIRFNMDMLCDSNSHIPYAGGCTESSGDPDNGVEYVLLTKDNMISHPVTQAVSTFLLNWGQSLRVTGSAQPLAVGTLESWGDADARFQPKPDDCNDSWYVNSDDPGEKHGNLVGVAALEDNGKVVALGDQDMVWNFWFNKGGQQQLIGNIFSWFFEVPTLSVNPNSLNFGASTTSLAFNITNSGLGTLTWSVSDNRNWIGVNPTGGSTTTESDAVTVTVNRSGLAPGSYSGTVTVNSNGGTETVSINMTVQAPPTLSVSPNSLDFGGSTTSLPFNITNIGIGTLIWNVSGNQNWLGVSPTGGTTVTESDPVTVTVNRSELGPGSYSGTVTVNSNGGTETVSVSMTVQAIPSLSVSPSSLDFGDSTTSLAFNITNIGTGTLIWNVSDNRNWIGVNPTGGSTTTESDPVAVTVNRSGLAPGAYSGTVTVNSNGGTATVSVSIAVRQPPPVSDFSGSPASGVNPLRVQFTDASTGVTDSRLWDFGDGQTSTQINPSHLYSYVGLYSVSLSLFGPGGNDTKTRPDYITVLDITTPDNPPEGESAIVSITLPQNFRPTGRTLYYREAGQSVYQSRALNLSGNDLEGTIPAAFVTIRGVEYYISLTNDLTPITYPATNPANNPAVIRVQIDQQLAPLALEGLTYKMISVPAILNSPGISSVLSDDYGEYNNQIWRLFRGWDAENELYSEYPDMDDTFTPGSAFWLVTRDGQPFDIENGLSVNSAENVDVELQSGWNQVGNPFAFPVAWDSIIGSGGLETNVENPVFYEGTDYGYGVTVLEPWEGYFVYNGNPFNYTLSFPPVEAASGLSKLNAGIDINGDEYLLQLAATLSGTRLKDSQNYLGLLREATDERDTLDFFEAPPIGDYLRFSIIERDDRFAGNFKSLHSSGQEWEIEISSTLPARPVQIILLETGQLPDNFQLHVFDRDYKRVIPLSENRFDVDLNEEFPIRHLKVILGTEEFTEGHNDGIATTPLQFSLEQNYPNPFNPETNIRYQIGQQSLVTLEIYNVLGKRVRTLINEVQDPGAHSVQWDGLDDSGHSVSSGVYIYILKAGQFITSRKLALIR